MNKTIPTLLFTGLILSSCTQSSITTNSNPTLAPSQMPSTTLTQITVKDGVFQADGSYTSPAGPENVGVKLTITNGLISDVVVDVRATHPTSKKMQTAFAGGIKDQVVGKKISELNITKVAGSSLTSGGFNQALDKIKTQMM